MNFLSLFLTLALMVISFIFYKLDVHLTVYNQAVVCKQKFNEFRNVMNIVSATTPNENRLIFSMQIKIAILTIKMICNIIYINFIQYVTNNMRRINRTTYEFTYTLKGKLYKILITQRNGYNSPLVLQISDEKEDEVTDKIVPYMGPNWDWHGVPLITPILLGYKSLTFEMTDGREITCVEYDNMTEKVKALS